MTYLLFTKASISFSVEAESAEEAKELLALKLKQASGFILSNFGRTVNETFTGTYPMIKVDGKENVKSIPGE